MAEQNFGDRLAQAVREKKSVAVVGIDPTLAMLPPELARKAEEGPAGVYAALSDFCLGIVTSVYDLVPAIKPNIAFFEAFGMHGLSIYKSVCLTAADMGLLVIGDVKRGDIGSTAAAYAQGLLGAPRVHLNQLSGIQPEDFQELVGILLGPHDALTLNPYLGSDSIKPFTERGLPDGQGFFVLVKTSNPSSAELQDLKLAEGGSVAEHVAGLVHGWGRDSVGAESGLSAVGAVVGATHPAELARYRELMPDTPFLIPGYGAQGGGADDVVGGFRADGSGAVVNASRSILQAWKKEEDGEWQLAARKAVAAMNEDLRGALEKAGKWNF